MTADDDHDAKAALITDMRQFTEKLSLSSAHINFIEEADKHSLQQAGWQIRQGVQFHWHNQDYANFDDFLDQLSSRKRKNIRKERASLSHQNIQFKRLCGDDIKPHHWDAFYQFYLSTIDKKWGGAYLNRAFFEAIGQVMSDQILLVMAEQDDRPIAGALNFMNQDCLFGRNWGCEIRLPDLHFETCYYRQSTLQLRLNYRALKQVRKACIRFNVAICLFSPIQRISFLMKVSQMRSAVSSPWRIELLKKKQKK